MRYPSICRDESAFPVGSKAADKATTIFSLLNLSNLAPRFNFRSWPLPGEREECPNENEPARTAEEDSR